MLKKIFFIGTLLGSFLFVCNVFAATWELNIYEPTLTTHAIWAQISSPTAYPIKFHGIEYNKVGYTTYDVTMRIQNHQVTAERTNVGDNINCTYTGVISNTTTAKGEVTCDHGYPVMAWDATIYVNQPKNKH